MQTGGKDPAAIHENVAGEINAIDLKVTPVDADVLVAEDSADGFTKKKIALTSLLSGGGVTGADTTTGSYTGDGTILNPITGIGFSPIFVKIWRRETVADAAIKVIETTPEIIDDNAAGGSVQYISTFVNFVLNRIISLDADGFTVDDSGVDADPNTLGVIYNFFCVGASSAGGLTIEESVSLATTPRTSNIFITKNSLALVNNGTYLVFFTCEIQSTNALTRCDARFEENNTTLLYAADAQFSAGGVTGYQTFSGTFRSVVSGATKTYDLDFRSTDNVNTVNIRNARTYALKTS